MNIRDSIILKGWYFYRKRSTIFSKSRRDDIITNQEKMYLLKKLERIDGIIISPILGSPFCYWIYSIIMTTLRVYFDKKWGRIQLVQKSMKNFYKQYSWITSNPIATYRLSNNWKHIDSWLFEFQHNKKLAMYFLKTNFCL